MRRYGDPAWLATLPDVRDEVVARWHLQLGDPFQPGGVGAWVAPARTAEGRDAVLKLGWRHPEALHEAEGLRVWDGHGAVRLLAHAELGETLALLLERCRPGAHLSHRPQSEQDQVIAALLSRLWQASPVGGPFRPLAEMCDRWADEFEAKSSTRPTGLDAGTVREGLATFRRLPRSAPGAVLLCTDLHAENVLSARREPWLMIDPKPYVGDPAYDVVQHLLNGPDRLQTDARGAAALMAGLLDLDSDRVRQWVFARCVLESVDRPDLRAVAVALAPG